MTTYSAEFGVRASDPTSLKLRLAGIDDCGQLSHLAISSKASNGYDEDFMAACVAEFTVDEKWPSAREVWLAEDETGRVLGFFDLRVETKHAEFEASFIAPAIKRRGVGRLLWARLQKRAQALGAERITIDSDSEARPLLRSDGRCWSARRPPPPSRGASYRGWRSELL